MEMMAVLRGLQALKQRCEIQIEIDSEYVKNGVTKWLTGWKRNGWRTAAKTAVKNRDLWQQLDEALSRHDVEWKWVKGHASHEDNNRCDELAREAAMTQSHGAQASLEV
jgi:ribonuclease HI